jgi:hypothetical protein
MYIVEEGNTTAGGHAEGNERKLQERKLQLVAVRTKGNQNRKRDRVAEAQ